MRAALVAAGLLATSMTVLIGWAIVVGRFSTEGGVLLALAWGKVTLADLYGGFGLFSGWVIYREASLWRAALFVVLVLTLGNAFAAGYVLVALLRSKGSWPRFWLGVHFREGGRG
ncbi:MAG: DUF1475 family protein [Deltaproteobacteria bacterium]|nr:DUF1475 family protein [Deltaproteobacteria bacterium]